MADKKPVRSLNIAVTVYPDQNHAMDELAYKLRLSRSGFVRMVIDYVVAHKAEFLAWVSNLD